MVEAERKIGELEEALEQARVEGQQQQGRVPEDANAREEVTALLAERSKISHAIGDVLRRHRRGSPLGSALREVPAFDDEADHDDLPAYLASAVDSHFEQAATRFEAVSMAHASGISEDAHHELQEQLQAATEERDHLQLELEQTRLERDNIESSHADIEHRLGEQGQHLDDFENVRRDLDQARHDLDEATARVSQLEAQLEEQEQMLRELWNQLPSRQPTSEADGLSGLKAAFASVDVANGAYAFNELVQRIRNLVSEDAKLVDRLAKFDEDALKHGADTERALQASRESQASLEAARKQLAELEERVSVSAEKEASMLERLNDLTENLEQVRAEKRTLQSRIETVEADKAKLSEQLSTAQNELKQLQDRPAEDPTKLRDLEHQVQDLQDEVNDLQEELEEAKGRESKTRAQLLEELSQVQSELSRTKTSLKQAERKLGRA
ncbi:hypothetical protein ACM66B_005998 [Microbotryomycetes sp. NB124-2]